MNPIYWYLAAWRICHICYHKPSIYFDRFFPAKKKHLASSTSHLWKELQRRLGFRHLRGFPWWFVRWSQVRSIDGNGESRAVNACVGIFCGVCGFLWGFKMIFFWGSFQGVKLKFKMMKIAIHESKVVFLIIFCFLLCYCFLGILPVA